jgi:flagellar biosynthesis anti-sigma factor FlgM
MKVDLTRAGLEPPETSANVSRVGQTSAGVAASRAGNTGGSDQARLSFDQARVQSLEAQVLAQPEVRSAKVQALQQAISDGTYAVPAHDVANALLQDVNAA